MARDNFFYLFVALLILLLATPVLTDLAWFSERVIRTMGFCLVLAIGVWSLQGSRRIFAVGMLLAVSGIVVSIAASAFEARAYEVASMAIFLAFLLIAIVQSLKQVAISSEVSANRLVGAVSVYVMLGIAWALAYALLHGFDADAFSLPAGSDDEPSVMFWMYYSFVTLTTLGYGDFLPVSASARALAYLEAVFGQLYVAILIAGLVSAYISARQSGER